MVAKYLLAAAGQVRRRLEHFCNKSAFSLASALNRFTTTQLQNAKSWHTDAPAILQLFWPSLFCSIPAVYKMLLGSFRKKVRDICKKI
jgi:hypothetical protein